MRKLILATIAALLMASGFIGAGAQPASAYSPISYYSCSASWSYGTRVCFDIGDDMFYIYTSSNTLWGQFPSNGHGGGAGFTGTSGVWLDYEWTHFPVGSGTHANTGSSPHLNPITAQEACYDFGQKICVYGGNHDYLEWFAASAGYEFIITVQ